MHVQEEGINMTKTKMVPRNYLILAGLSVFVLFYHYFSDFQKSVGDAVTPNNSSLVRIPIDSCDCFKYVLRDPTLEETNDSLTPKNTTCSYGSFLRGLNQKVVGFTFFELPENSSPEKEQRKYLEGIRENLKLMKEYYPPGFIMRLYYQVQSEEVMKILCELACSDPYFDLCNAQDNPRFGNASILYPLLWRFLPVLDRQVDLFFSRDLDSRISSREMAAVKEFLETPGKDFHVMRDHPAHATFMMGGLWGVKMFDHRKQFLKSFANLFKDKSGLAYIPRDRGGYDQIALRKYVWPWAQKYVLAHDSYLCKKYSDTQPFPVQRKPGIGNYVGSVVGLNATLQLDNTGSRCPYECRPKDHKNWVYC